MKSRTLYEEAAGSLPPKGKERRDKIPDSSEFGPWSQAYGPSVASTASVWYF